MSDELHWQDLPLTLRHSFKSVTLTGKMVSQKKWIAYGNSKEVDMRKTIETLN